MTLRDKLKIKTKDCPQDPEWVQNGTTTTQTLYKCAVQEYDRITKLIESNQVAGATDTRLVLSEIARLAGKDKSIINPRRQPALCHWLTQKNVELQLHYKKYAKRPKCKNAHTLAAVNAENIKLRQQAKRQTVAELQAVVEEFFQSNLLDDRDKLAREITHLKMENHTLQDNLERLKLINHRLSEQIAQLLKHKQ